MLTEGPTPEETATVGAHFGYLKAATEAGRVILVGRTLNSDEETFGICVFNAESPEEAREFMEADPAVKSGVMTAQVFPYRIALFGPENVAQ